MPFGRFAGVELCDLPDDYLEWLGSLGDLRDPLRSAVAAEIARRYGPADTMLSMADDIVRTGYRTLAQRYHPDHGGDTVTMQVLNRAARWLRSQLRGLHE